MKIKLFTIPNFITLGNLLCGVGSIVASLVYGNLMLAFGLVILSAVFDFFDGFVARMLKQSSEIGVQLDSLADMVSFGTAPAAAMSALFVSAPSAFGWSWLDCDVCRFLPFVITAFSALRLAKFNIDERQTTSFIGMPVPAHALFWASIGYAFHSAVPADSIGFIAGTIVVAILFSFLLVSEVPMFSLKVKSLAWKGNELRYILIAGAVVFVALFGVLGIAGTIILYITLSFFNKRR